MTNLISRFVRDESGATAIEYGLIAALIAVVIITGLDHGRHEPEHQVHQRSPPACANRARREIARTAAAPEKAAVRLAGARMIAEAPSSGRAAAACWPPPRAGIWRASPFPISCTLRWSPRFVAFRAGARIWAPAAIGLHLLAGLIGLALGFALVRAGLYRRRRRQAVRRAWRCGWGCRICCPIRLVATVLGGVLTLALLALRRCRCRPSGAPGLDSQAA